MGLAPGKAKANAVLTLNVLREARLSKEKNLPGTSIP